jgi:hypothetical protein
MGIFLTTPDIPEYWGRTPESSKKSGFLNVMVRFRSGIFYQGFPGSLERCARPGPIQSLDPAGDPGCQLLVRYLIKTGAE